MFMLIRCEFSQIRVKDGSSLTLRCLVESINIYVFLVFETARNRYGVSFDANIISAFILLGNYCFGTFNTAIRFVFLEIVFRN